MDPAASATSFLSVLSSDHSDSTRGGRRLHSPYQQEGPLQEEIFIKHCGVMQFRGVPELQSVFQISRGAVEGRTFPPGVANTKKATAVGPAKGLQAVLLLDPQDSRGTPWAA